MLIRHGQYTARKRRGALDGELTELGRRQAEAVARRLEHRPVSLIRFSTLLRTRQTASVIAGGAPDVDLMASHLLRECLPELPADVADIAPARHLVTQVTERFAGMAQMERASRRYLRASKEPHTEVLITHGNVIREFARRVVGAPAGAWMHMDVAHCSMTEISIGGRLGPMLLSLNDTGHLNNELCTY